MYLLPAIDILDGKAVRVVKGNYGSVTVYRDDPAAQAQAFEEAGATWLHVVDLEEARSGHPDSIKTIERILRKTLLKVEVGDGIRSLDTLKHLRAVGVDRMVLGTSLASDPAFAQAAIQLCGKQLVVKIDVGRGEVAGCREGAAAAAEERARQFAEQGFRHLIYTDMVEDGVRTGLDVRAYEDMARAFGNSVIVAGDVASVFDIQNLGAIVDSIEGIMVGRALYEGTLSVEAGVTACRDATHAADVARVIADPCGRGVPSV